MSSYSVPAESRRVLKNAILDHPSHQDLPPECRDMLDLVKFEGHDEPRMAINWRFAESVSALKGLEAILLNVLLSRKYGLTHQEVVINTDHAQLFLMSCLIQEVNPAAPDSPIMPTELRELNSKYSQYFPSWDLHQQVSSLYRKAVTNIYQCRDGRFFHLHASLNPDPSLRALGLPRDRPELDSNEAAWPPFVSKMAEKDATEWDHILADEFRQASTICFAPGEYGKTEQGKAHAGIGLYQIHYYPDSLQKPGWWQKTESTSVRRPLAGLKVVDLTRIVAGPSIGRGLAELGASVMRVTGPHIADFSGLHPDLNWGKWNCHLDLRTEADQARFRDLVLGADVIINGYRPGVLDKYGAGFEDIFKLGRERGRGFIYVRECCFGWVGPWSHRAGWQPISDACSGVSIGFGRAMGNNEAVTPVLPNSDYCTGIAGTCATLQALMSQEQQGGSYLIDTALNYYNSWLVEQVGEYSPDVWEEVWTRNGRRVFRHFHSMNYTLPHYMEMFQKEGMFNLDFFEMRETKALGLKIRTVKPVLRFPKGTVELGYNVGTRGNGVDQPYWPDDLATEIVQ
ncbi:alpha-methylacyl-CoA racemase [Talaromyces proteolyticus]|uniref:Alpha-methylacyl-CoA racemase n=1 Tax=Talaromyces proteolyticus TaxID=1131652 RepID=A0AAD4KKX1_9EURO|nr:alpha-methylacyl-CoA racemase [Talaromyces proteolyticus]KAH8690556.1 alpha-methylacyl-CoA racemase [Talaromyces proteolyticus]